MGNVNNYKSLIKTALSQYAERVRNSFNVDFDVIELFDDERMQYMVMKLGWQGSKRLQHIPVHVAIRDGKIWVEADWTEDGITTYFLAHNVPKHNIVLGFQAPIMRQYTEFAVA